MDVLPTVANSPDPRILARLERIRFVLLGGCALLCSAGLVASLVPGSHAAPAWLAMRPGTALAVLACTVAAAFCTYGRPRNFNFAGAPLAVVGMAAVVSATNFAGLMHHPLAALLIPESSPIRPGGMDLPTAAGFLLLALLLPFLGARSGLLSAIADLFISLLAFDTLSIFGRSLLAAADLSGATSNSGPLAAILILVSLTFVAFLYRTQFGILSPLVMGGVGGRFSRVLLPVLVLLPFLRESGRARLLSSVHLPEHAAAAALGSLAAILSALFLLVIAHRISAMEAKIRDLSLRDELTGLLNLRGFRMLADQGIRMARRSHVPFSVLFVDLDHLKRINDGLGHDVGSRFLTETARLLQATFRESDVIGRIGGDEFAVAGQFNEIEIAAAAARLRSVIADRTSPSAPTMPLSLSVGYATSNDPNAIELEELLQNADLAMYEEKRERRHSGTHAVTHS